MGCCGSRSANEKLHPTKSIVRDRTNRGPRLDDPFNDLHQLDEDAEAQEAKYFASRAGSNTSVRTAVDQVGEEEERYYASRDKDGHRRSTLKNTIADRKKDPANRLHALVNDDTDLTPTDRDILHRLSANLTHPPTVTYKNVSTIQAGGELSESRLVLDMPHRLLVEGASRRLRVPFKDILNVARSGGTELTVEFRVHEPVSFLFKDGGECEEACVLIEEIIDHVQAFDYPLLSFPYIREARGSDREVRIVQVDVPNRLISNLTPKGDIKSEFHFSVISRVEKVRGSTTVKVSFKEFDSYDYTATTEEDQEIIYMFLSEAASGSLPVHKLSHDEISMLPFWPCRPEKSDMLEVDTKGRWVKRWVVLTASRLLVFKDDRSAAPLAVVCLLGADAEKKDGFSIVVTCPATSIETCFRASSQGLREEWFQAIEDTQVQANRSFRSYKRIFAERAKTKGDLED